MLSAPGDGTLCIGILGSLYQSEVTSFVPSKRRIAGYHSREYFKLALQFKGKHHTGECGNIEVPGSSKHNLVLQGANWQGTDLEGYLKFGELLGILSTPVR